MAEEQSLLTKKYMSLVSIGTGLNSQLDLLQLLPFIMLNAKDLLEAEASSLFLTDELEEYLFCEVAIGEKGEIVKAFSRIELGQGIVGWVAKNRRTVLLEDAYNDERFSDEWDTQTGFRTRSLICVPLFVQHKLMGVLEVLNKTDNRIFQESDEMLLNTLADMAAIAIDNARLAGNLKKRVLEISMLYEFENLISSEVDLHDLGKWLLSRMLKIIEAKTGSILVYDNSLSCLKVLEAKGIDNNVAKELNIKIGEGIAGYVAENKEALLIKNVDADPRFQASSGSHYENSSLISVPLLCQGELIGVLNINNKISGYAFTEADLKMVKAAASRLAITIKNAHFFSENVRNDAEEQRAHKLMTSIIPREAPKSTVLQFAEYYMPFKAIGGDYYSYFTLEKGVTAILVIDVSGHGLSAALLSVLVNTLVSTFEIEIMKSPAQFLLNLNESLLNRMANNFVTAVYTIIDNKNDKIIYGNGGHARPLLARKKENDVLTLKSGGKLLGVVSSVTFEEREIPFRKGDCLVLYTDGLTEVLSGSKRIFYDEEDLQNLIHSNRDKSSQALADIIVNEVKKTTGAIHFSDDVTLLVIQKNS